MSDRTTDAETDPKDRPTDTQPRVEDVRSAANAGDRSRHRRHAWLYEDLLN